MEDFFKHNPNYFQITQLGSITLYTFTNMPVKTTFRWPMTAVLTDILAFDFPFNSPPLSSLQGQFYPSTGIEPWTAWQQPGATSLHHPHPENWRLQKFIFIFLFGVEKIYWKTVKLTGLFKRTVKPDWYRLKVILRYWIGLVRPFTAKSKKKISLHL